MKKFLKYFVLACNIIILILAVRWFSRDNIYEPLIVIVGQLASLLSIYFGNSGNVTLANFRNTKFDGEHEGSGDFNAKGMTDSDVKFNK